MSTTATASAKRYQRVVAAFNGVDLSEDRGPDESPAKLMWIAAAIIIAGLAIAFAITIYNNANGGVPDPAVPAGG
jgi:hypothetical protein